MSLKYSSSTLIDREVIPLLASRFLHLQILSLTYPVQCTELTAQALEAIARIKSLVQIHLSLGCLGGWRRTWLVDHEAIRRCVKRLPLLTTLAMGRDTYDVDQNADPEQYERYYSDGRINAETADEVGLSLLRWVMHREGQDESRSRVKSAFEMIHRRKMLQEADKYVKLRCAEDGSRLKL